jgi:hypothetical protein
VVVRAAWFNIAPTAIALPSNTTVNVTIQVVGNDSSDNGKRPTLFVQNITTMQITHITFIYSQPGNGIWVIYDHFQGCLRHDPDYGLTLGKFTTRDKQFDPM